MSRLKQRLRDTRLAVIAGSVGAIAVLGYLIGALPGRGVEADRTGPFGTLQLSPSADASTRTPPKEATPDTRQALPDTAIKALDRASDLLEQKRYDAAIATLSAAQSELRDVARAYEMLGRALEGKRDYLTARDFYTAAIDRDPLMADAYWGVATTSEALGDLEAAMGAMRSYLHVEPDKHPDRLRVAQARSALWEWEAQLGKGPWGPTKGIPPGFTAADIKRDGRGVAMRVAIPGTEQPDGSAQAEIKHADKQVIFPRP